MTSTLLTTKLFIPPLRSELVPRQHLIDKLNAGVSGKLTLVSAPAGFGKTTTLSAWVRQNEIPFGWITLDENDNDPGRFLTYLTACLSTLGIEVDSELISLLQNPGQEQVKTILNNLINQIAVVERRFALVLDDYHLIQNGSIHQILAYILEYLPPKVHLVLATRADPPLPIARLRARGELTELRSRDLRFQPDEGAEFLNQVFELELELKDVYQLVSRTDGWVAGLQLAAIALTGRQDPVEYIQQFSGSQTYIVDFLTSEVLEGQPEEIQTFLLKTAILDRMNASVCEALTDQGNCQKILNDLRANNIFLQALDDVNQWYAYHQLFRDLLTQRLLEKWPEDIPGLYLKASHWCDEHNLMNDAIAYAIRGQHLERAANLVEKHAQETIQKSEITTFIRWIGELPENEVFKRPNLCILYAWALLISNRELDSVTRYLDHIQSSDRVILGKLNAVRSIYTMQLRRVTEAIELARSALDHLPEDEYFFRQIAGWNLSAVLFLSGDEVESIRILDDVVHDSLASGNKMVAVVTLCRLGSIRLQKGDLKAAQTYYQRALDVAAENQEKPLPVASEALLGLGKINWEWYQRESAYSLLSEGIELSKFWRDTASVEGRIIFAHLQISMGDFTGVALTINRTKEIASQKILTETGKQYVDLQEAYIQLRQGNLSFSDAWAQKRELNRFLDVAKLEPSEATGEDVIRNFELSLYARILMEDSRYADALDILSKLLPAYQYISHLSKIIETHILTGIAQNMLGDEVSALGVMQQALSLAAPANFLRVFIEEGDVVMDMVRDLHSQGEEIHFTQKILEANQPVELEPRPVKNHLDVSEQVSPREIEILYLLESELSVPDIAGNIHISVSTLRTHIRNIYRKLEVHSRFEAVSKAKDLNIL